MRYKIVFDFADQSIQDYMPPMYKIQFIQTTASAFILEVESLSLSARQQPPRSQRKALELGGGRFDEHEKGDGANEDAEDVGNVVAVALNHAGAAAIDAAILLGLERAREGSSHEGIFQGVCRRRNAGRKAGSLSEKIDEFEDEEARECTTQVRDAGDQIRETQQERE